MSGRSTHMLPGRGGPRARVGDKIPEERRTHPSLLGSSTILFFLALVKVLVHLLTAGNYGYFRDELYYIAASERLALGYVDFPSFVALATALARATLGDSLLALHLLPALAGAAVVMLAGLMARELGGGRFAQGLAGGVPYRADRHHATAHPPALACGPRLLPVRQRGEAVPRFGLGLRRPLRALRGAGLQVLLPRPGVPRAVCRGGRSDRAVLRRTQSLALALARLRGGAGDKRGRDRPDHGRSGA